MENILWHAEAAQTAELNQRDFISAFPLADWLKLHNIVERYDSHRYTQASFLYILAEFDLPALIEVHGNIKHVFNTERERYETTIFAALASGSHRPAARMLESLVGTSEELSLLFTQWKPDKGQYSAFGRDFTYSQNRGVASYLAEKGDETLLAFALASGISTDSKNMRGRQVDPDSKDTNRRKPLSYAAANGHEAIVKVLLATGQVGPDSEITGGRTPLSYSAANGHEAIVKVLLATGQVKPDSKARGPWSGLTPLSYSAANGHEAVVKVLATGQVDPDSKDANGRAPLSYSAANGHEAIVKVLLATGQVQPDSEDRDGMTPLSYSSRTPLSYAAERGHEAVVQLLLAHKAEPDSKATGEYNSGRTPLSDAAANVHEAIAKLLPPEA